MKSICKICKIEKDVSEFYKDKKRKIGIGIYCKMCSKTRSNARYAANPELCKQEHKIWVSKNQDRVKEHKVKHSYGISAFEFNALLKICVICGTKNELCIDHSHQSGRIRGMLCTSCNKGLGFFRDNPSLLFRAAEYVLGIAKPDIFEATYEKVEE